MPLDVLNGRRARDARIRPRGSVDEVFDRLRRFLASPAPAGWSQDVAEGYAAASRIPHRIAMELYGSVLDNGASVVPQDVMRTATAVPRKQPPSAGS
jgi:hypothetical protein